MTVRHRVLSATQNILRRSGFWIDRYSRQDQARRQRLLTQARIDHVLDVGAHHGEYARELRSAGYEGTITSFEPHSPAYAELLRRSDRDPRWTAHRLALGESAGRQTLRVSRNEVSSSLLSVSRSHTDPAPESVVIASVDVDVVRLDDIIGDTGTSLMLKADVQGAESSVLRGAPVTLERVHVMELELSMIELYEHQETLIEMLRLVRELGFVLAYPIPGFTDPSSGRCLQMNGIFVRC